MKRVCVFCGSSRGGSPRYVEAARDLGALLATSGLGVVFGGGRVGLMGALADAALAKGGEVIGVLPRALATREVAHEGLSDLVIVGSMHERKARMAGLSDAFLALPGGLGTLEELAEVLTWAQLGIHEKPCGILDVDGYFQALVRFFDHATAEGFVHPADRSRLFVEKDAARLVVRLSEFQPIPARRWLDWSGA